MALDDLAAPRQRVEFVEEDKIMHTTKMAERAFGVPIEQIGRVEMRDGDAVLVVSYRGRDFDLRWGRQPAGMIYWFVAGRDKPIILGDQGRAARRLAEALDGVPV